MGHQQARIPPGWFRLASRVRGVVLLPGFLGIVASLLAAMVLPEGDLRTTLAMIAGLGGFSLVMLGGLFMFLPAPKLVPRPVAAPVAGRWSALNSPATRVPSHGTHGHGQTFAIDLVHEPADGSRPAFGGRGFRGFRPPEDYPGFGQPILAPAAGRVVSVRDRARDHRSRSNWLGFGYLLLTGTLREIAGSRHLLGNYIILDLGEGVYAVLAHLQRGSVAVRPGDRVDPGAQIGRCGNSGNSSEPHLHFHLMDRPTPLIAAGLPFQFTGVTLEEGAEGDGGVPSDGQAMHATTRLRAGDAV